MSFLKISDPTKRDAMVKEYLDLKKNIRDNLLSERTGEMEMQSDLTKFFKPITETQKATAKEITEELKPIKEGIEKLPQAITFTAFPSIDASKEDILKLGPVAVKALKQFLTKDGADKTFGIYDKNGEFYIGDKPIVIKDNNIIVDDEEYKGTPGLWELIVAKKPNRDIYNPIDHDNYKKLMINTNAIWDRRNEYGRRGVVVIPSDPNALLERLDLLL